MIPTPSDVRVWLAIGRTDMRRGMNGLALQVQEALQRDPFLCGGSHYVAEADKGHTRAATPGFPRHIISDALQQFQDGVLRLEASTLVARDARLHETALSSGARGSDDGAVTLGGHTNRPRSSRLA